MVTPVALSLSRLLASLVGLTKAATALPADASLWAISAPKTPVAPTTRFMSVSSFDESGTDSPGCAGYHFISSPGSNKFGEGPIWKITPFHARIQPATMHCPS